MIKKIYQNSIPIYKVILFLITTIFIVYLFPKGGKFKYEYTQGKPWLYDNLYAPFDFAIHKTENEINEEKKQIKQHAKLYFLISENKKNEVLNKFKSKIDLLTSNKSSKSKKKYLSVGEKIINKVYQNGFVDDKSLSKVTNNESIIALRKGNSVEEIPFLKLITTNKILPLIKEEISNLSDEEVKGNLLSVLLEILQPNVSFDANFTEKELNQSLKTISLTKGKVSQNEKIILKGDIVEGKTFNVLESFKNASQSQIWSDANYYWIVFGYTLLVSLALLMLLLFIKQYRPEIFAVNNKITFIFFNVFIMFLAQTLVIKYNADYLYIVPMIILPIVIKAFFDAYNESFSKSVYNFIPFTDKEIEEEAEEVLSYINDKTSIVAFDENNDLAAFGVSFPSISKALQKTKGKLFPLGWYHLWKAVKFKNDTIDLMIVGTVPKWQNKGVSAILDTEMSKRYISAGAVWGITNPQIETNIAANAWEKYDAEPYMRRRCYIKNID